MYATLKIRLFVIYVSRYHYKTTFYDIHNRNNASRALYMAKFRARSHSEIIIVSTKTRYLKRF